MPASDIIRLKKIFVGDIIAAITGIEEEHIEWLLNHMKVKKSKLSTQRNQAVEIDSNGQETILNNQGSLFKKEDCSTCSEENETSFGEEQQEINQEISKDTDKVIQVFERNENDIIYFSEKQAHDLKTVIDSYTMMLNIEMIQYKKPILEEDIKNRRENMVKNNFEIA